MDLYSADPSQTERWKTEQQVEGGARSLLLLAGDREPRKQVSHCLQSRCLAPSRLLHLFAASTKAIDLLLQVGDVVCQTPIFPCQSPVSLLDLRRRMKRLTGRHRITEALWSSPDRPYADAVRVPVLLSRAVNCKGCIFEQRLA